jgi:hypothetical protein
MLTLDLRTGTLLDPDIDPVTVFTHVNIRKGRYLFAIPRRGDAWSFEYLKRQRHK